MSPFSFWERRELRRIGMDRDRLAANYNAVLARAAEAATRAGRAGESWHLVAVTKTVTAEVAGALAELGARNLGENRVDELLRKREALAGKQVRWHLIGHLQTNKVRKVVGAADLIGSVDSVRLAEEIERVASARGARQDILLEVNISGEESKYGLWAAAAEEAAAQLGNLPHVRLCGLMTMAPIVANPEETRPVFRGLRELAEKIAAGGHFAEGRYELSMGMTQDFEVAIEEGATLIRVGSALFEGV
jgi:pyridoxal phosphate enzyme (YggS family)